jgi:hypothetical protein
MMQSCFPHVSKMLTFTFNRANNVIIKNAIILNIIHNACNLHRICHMDIISCSINESQRPQPLSKYYMVLKAISSISARTKSHLRRWYRKWRHRKLLWPEMTSPEVTWPEVCSAHVRISPRSFSRPFSPYFSPVFFQTATFKISVSCFSSTWRYKTFHFPLLFSRTFSNRNVWNATLLAFLVHDVIKHFIFPYFFRPQLCKTTLLACLVHDVTKHFIFPYFYPVLSQTATFEIQRLKYQLVVFLVHDVIKSSFSLRIILHGITWHRMT